MSATSHSHCPQCNAACGSEDWFCGSCGHELQPQGASKPLSASGEELAEDTLVDPSRPFALTDDTATPPVLPPDALLSVNEPLAPRGVLTPTAFEDHTDPTPSTPPEPDTDPRTIQDLLWAAKIEQARGHTAMADNYCVMAEAIDPTVTLTSAPSERPTPNTAVPSSPKNPWWRRLWLVGGWS